MSDVHGEDVTATEREPSVLARPLDEVEAEWERLRAFHKAFPSERVMKPAYESCPECGVRWGTHRGVTCAEAEQRERALDHAD